tara:strand:- start:155 stop:274 length:120 start_codon:yes stop_codon:yes gene_type:complete
MSIYLGPLEDEVCPKCGKENCPCDPETCTCEAPVENSEE